MPYEKAKEGFLDSRNFLINGTFDVLGGAIRAPLDVIVVPICEIRSQFNGYEEDSYTRTRRSGLLTAVFGLFRLGAGVTTLTITVLPFPRQAREEIADFDKRGSKTTPCTYDVPISSRIFGGSRINNVQIIHNNVITVAEHNQGNIVTDSQQVAIESIDNSEEKVVGMRNA